MAKQVKNDISNKTVMVMLILVILVSSLCLGVYMNALNDVRNSISEAQSIQSADLSITIDRPANTTPVDAGAKMTINIEDNGSEESVDLE